jgi:Bacteriocin-protection, YdeI or OmpD-Associated
VTAQLLVMTGAASNIRFKARLLRPAGLPKGTSWAFIILPREASAKLPTREVAGVEIGELAQLEIVPVETEPEPRVPADLRKALMANPEARAIWSDITPIARRDWTHWITSAKQSDTRARQTRNDRAWGKLRPDNS